MGNSASRSKQWSPDPVKKTGPVCGHQQPVFPYRVCNSEPGHEGSHCHEKQGGTQMIRVWWK